VFELTNIEQFLEQDFITRSRRFLSAFIAEEVPEDVLHQCVKVAFKFLVPVVQVAGDVACLELFHGPLLALKDFGGRFMAQVAGEHFNRHFQ